MNSKSIQFIQVSPEELESKILEGIKVHLDLFLQDFKPKSPTDYLTRKEVAELFDVDISTIHNWCKSGKLTPYGIGNRVYFKREDVDNSLTPLF